MTDRFREIYRTREWDPTHRSGPGSDPERSREYLEILRERIGRPGIRRVVDLGCGDWSLAREVEWGEVEYVGVDVVPELIDSLRRRFQRPGVRFERRDLLRDPLPPGDLAIVKDVLQHWPNAAVHEFLPRLGAYAEALVTNDARIHTRGWRTLWLWRESIPPNVDTAMGGYRPLALTDEPFSLPAERLARFHLTVDRVRFLKEVLLLRTQGRGTPPRSGGSPPAR